MRGISHEICSMSCGKHCCGHCAAGEDGNTPSLGLFVLCSLLQPYPTLARSQSPPSWGPCGRRSLLPLLPHGQRGARAERGNVACTVCTCKFYSFSSPGLPSKSQASKGGAGPGRSFLGKGPVFEPARAEEACLCHRTIESLKLGKTF